MSRSRIILVDDALQISFRRILTNGTPKVGLKCHTSVGRKFRGNTEKRWKAVDILDIFHEKWNFDLTNKEVFWCIPPKFYGYFSTTNTWRFPASWVTERKLFHTNTTRFGDSVSLELWTTYLHHNLRLQPFLAKWHILNRGFCRIFSSLPRFRLFINSSSIDPYAQVYTSETNSSPKKMDGWKTTFLLTRPIFRFHGRFSGVYDWKTTPFPCYRSISNHRDFLWNFGCISFVSGIQDCTI